MRGILKNYFVVMVVTLQLCVHMNRTLVAQTSETTEQKHVLASMEVFLSDLQNDDTIGVHSVVSPDFVIFDNGRRMNADSMLTSIKKLHGQGIRPAWTITEPQVHVKHDNAWISYVNRGSIQSPSGVQEAQWLESAVLERRNGGWRIVFLHSTRVPSPTPPTS